MRRFGLGSLAILVLVVSGPSVVATAAEPVFLQLKIQGTDVRGDVALKGVEGMIECLAYEQEVTMPGSAAVTGQEQERVGASTSLSGSPSGSIRRRPSS